jgi:hypothetical protein
MKRVAIFLPVAIVLAACPFGEHRARGTAQPAPPRNVALPWPAGLPVYDHVVIIVEENKDYGEIIGNPNAPYINNVLKAEGANFTRMYGEEHWSQGNYFWLFSGSCGPTTHRSAWIVFFPPTHHRTE